MRWLPDVPTPTQPITQWRDVTGPHSGGVSSGHHVQESLDGTWRRVTLRDPNPVDGLDALPELHTLCLEYCVDHREWRRCSCGLVFETFGNRETCPLEEADADLCDAHRRAMETWMSVYRRWQASSQRAKAELDHALDMERR